MSKKVTKVYLKKKKIKKKDKESNNKTDELQQESKKSKKIVHIARKVTKKDELKDPTFLPETLLDNPNMNRPKRNNENKINKWNVLGSPLEFEKLDKVYNPKKQKKNNLKTSLASQILLKQRVHKITEKMKRMKLNREKERRKERKKLKNMSFEQRLIYTKDRRRMKLWQKQNKIWDHDMLHLSKKFDKHPSDLIINRSESFRAKQEELSLLEQTASLKEKFGIHTWKMSLRGNNQLNIAIGNQFNAISSTLLMNKEYKHTSTFKTLRSKQLNHNTIVSEHEKSDKSWYKSSYIKEKHRKQYEKIKEILPAAHKDQILLASEYDENSLYNLSIQGTNLFDTDADIDSILYADIINKRNNKPLNKLTQPNELKVTNSIDLLQQQQPEEEEEEEKKHMKNHHHHHHHL